MRSASANLNPVATGETEEPAETGGLLLKSLSNDFTALVNVSSKSIIRGSKGIRTPDPLHAMQVRYQAAPWTQTSFPRLLHNGECQSRAAEA